MTPEPYDDPETDLPCEICADFGHCPDCQGLGETYPHRTVRRGCTMFGPEECKWCGGTGDCPGCGRND